MAVGKDRCHAEIISLRQHLESLIEHERELREAKFDAIEELAHKHNELLDRMDQRDRLYVTEDDYGRRHEDLVARVAGLEQRQAMLLGQTAGRERLTGYLIGAAGVIVAVVAVVVSHL